MKSVAHLHKNYKLCIFLLTTCKILRKGAIYHWDFVDKLREKTKNVYLYSKLFSFFPLEGNVMVNSASLILMQSRNVFISSCFCFRESILKQVETKLNGSDFSEYFLLMASIIYFHEQVNIIFNSKFYWHWFEYSKPPKCKKLILYVNHYELSLTSVTVFVSVWFYVVLFNMRNTPSSLLCKPARFCIFSRS